MKRLLLVTFAAALFLIGCSSEEPTTYNLENDLSKSHNFPELILLPEGFEPEGIATGKGSTFFVGSLATGTIYKGDYRTGEGSILVPGSDRLAFGLSYDPRSDYLFVAGGTTGHLYVYNGTTGALVGEFSVAGSIIINDVVVTKNAVYMSESLRPVVYKLPLGPAGRLPGAGSVQEITLTGEYQFIENAPTPFGINNNGVEATPNGKYLIVNNMADGSLYRVDAETGHSILITGVNLPFGDGLLLQGHTLYVVQNFLNQIAEVKLGAHFLSGTLVREITHPAFEIPTTVASFGNSLYAVNARFTLPPGPFYVVKVSR
jgi:WD40 repeat protein